MMILKMMNSNNNIPDVLDSDFLNSFIERQLNVWPLAHDNFFRLGETQRKRIEGWSMATSVQLNPARIVSTGANVDRRSINGRPCFLCACNRPAEQLSVEFIKGWHLLVNPYPILPVHFTIASTGHTPQAYIPLDMAVMAEKLPGMTIFFNGARAGASAPDHSHVQAVLSCELPLTRLVMEQHNASQPGFISSEDFNVELPFQFISGIITPDNQGMEWLSKIPGAFGIESVTGQPDPGLVNSFMWIDETGLLRVVIVPRSGHRPECYGMKDNEFVISPGAIDMAGLMISPRSHDFERMDYSIMKRIYSDVAFADELPANLKIFFNI